MRNKNLYSIECQETTPFLSAEEAWFWCCLCEQMKSNHPTYRPHRIVRPCDAADILVAVRRLQQEGKLRPSHIRVLSKYGVSQVPPHPHFGDSSKICALWKEALSFLNTILVRKGIVSV